MNSHWYSPANYNPYYYIFRFLCFPYCPSSVPGPSPGSQVTFGCHISIGPSGLWQLISLFLFLVTLTVLKRDFVGSPWIRVCLVFFSWLYQDSGFLEEGPTVKGSSIPSYSRSCVTMNCHSWHWRGWVCPSLASPCRAALFEVCVCVFKSQIFQYQNWEENN